MLAGNYISNDWDEDIILVRDGPSLLNEKVLAKYYYDLIKLDESNMPMGDYMYQDEFQNLEYDLLNETYKKDQPLPMNYEYGLVIQSKEISTIHKEFKENDKLITNELNKDVAINKTKVTYILQTSSITRN